MPATTSDGRVTVDELDGPWAIELHVDETTSAIKCKCTDEGAFFFLLAKDYAVAADHVAGVDELLQTIYPGSYRKMFASVAIEDIAPLTIAGRQWFEARYRFVHAKRGEIEKTERVYCHDEHVLLVSAEGSPADMARFAALARAWMDSARFAALA